MENITQCFSFNYKHILLDEIALDGLQGVGIELLWKRLEKRTDTSITSKMKEKFWKFLTNTESISIFNVPESPPLIDIVDRFTLVDEATGYVSDPSNFLDGPYEWCPIENTYGSCSNYNTRILLAKDQIHLMTYEKVKLLYGDKLALVATLEERWHALAPHLPITYLNHLTTIHYGLLELIGKGRENGQMTIGTTNLSKIIKEPKLLFYNRSVLQKLDLIDVQYTTQITCGKAMKSILLRLKRFKQLSKGSLPKVGLIANMVEYLLEQPDHSEINEVMIRKRIMTSKDCKRFQKATNIFSFDDRDVIVTKKVSKGEKQTEIVKKKFISLLQRSDESSSEEEGENVSLPCQYKVGVGLMRQAYERILDAGLKGLTQTEIAQLLGVEFYTSRSICRIFKTKNLVREFLEDKGRQRTARYIALAATKEIDKEYAKEKDMLFEHIRKTNESKESIIIDGSNSDCDIPIKKLKLDEDSSEKDKQENTENSLVQLNVLEGFEHVKESVLNAKKNLTLRQLKFGNGILKVIKQHSYVVGFQTLSMLVSKQIGEPPMDTKGLKKFVQKLMTDGQLKVMKITRPKKFFFVICAPNIKPTDDIIQNIYIQLCSKPILKEKTITHVPDPARPKWQFIYQRYVKIQKLHEFVTKFVYFNETLSTNSSDDNSQTNFAPGFTSLLTIIPEMTIEFALSNLNNVDSSDVASLKMEKQLLELKIQDAPEKYKKLLSQSQSIQNSIKVILKILAALGLIQLVHTPSTSRRNSANSCIFYVNRRAKILNTAGKWPRTVDENVLENSFYFETFDDVKKYWTDVTVISSNTIINITKRESLKLRHPLRSETDVEMFDTGDRLGDGLGPCGFDSSIFMDIPRLWRKFVFKPPNTPISAPPKKLKRIAKKKIKKPKKVANKLVPKVDKRKRPPDTPALKWSSFEDKIIMLCKAAITVLSPTSQPGSLRVRNIVARDLLAMNDPNKTAACCHKRSVVLESNSILAYEKDCIINEMRRHRDLIQKYDGLLKNLRHRHNTSTAKYINDARLPLLELIWIASQIERAKPYVKRIPCIALNFDDFNRNYTVAPTSSNKPYNVYRTPTTSEPEFATLKEGILLSVMLSTKKQVSKETAKKIYNIFEVYPESTLRSAVEQLRKGGAIAARDKCMNNNMKQIHFNEIVESSYRISAAYRRKMLNRFEVDFIVNLADVFSSKVPQKGLKGTCEINCLLCEMTASDILEIKCDTAPMVTGSAGSIMQEEQMNVIDMETKYKLKSGTVGWKGKDNVEIYSEFYQGMDYKSILDSISKESVVSFSDNDIVYDIKDPIILYLEEKGEKGSTFQELLEHLSSDRRELRDRLKDLEAKKMVKRLGYYENLLTLTKFSTPMLLQIEPNLHIVPTPWLTLDGQIRVDIFIKWTSVIVNKIFESPGCSVEYLSNSIECISVRSVQDICTFLHGCDCAILQCIEKRPVDLFSMDEVVPELGDYNPYESPDNILVFPVKNMLTRYACLRRKVADETDKAVI